MEPESATGRGKYPAWIGEIKMLADPGHRKKAFTSYLYKLNRKVPAKTIKYLGMMFSYARDAGCDESLEDMKKRFEIALDHTFGEHGRCKEIFDVDGAAGCKWLVAN